MVQGGSGGRLVKVFSDDHQHSYLAAADCAAVMDALLDGVEHGDKPTPQGIAAHCEPVGAAFAPARGCHLRAADVPLALSTRVLPR